MSELVQDSPRPDTPDEEISLFHEGMEAVIHLAKGLDPDSRREMGDKLRDKLKALARSSLIYKTNYRIVNEVAREFQNRNSSQGILAFCESQKNEIKTRIEQFQQGITQENIEEMEDFKKFQKELNTIIQGQPEHEVNDEEREKNESAFHLDIVGSDCNRGAVGYLEQDATEESGGNEACKKNLEEEDAPVKDSDILGNHVLVGNDEDRMSDIGSGHIVHNADAKIARQAAEDEIQESEKGGGNEESGGNDACKKNLEEDDAPVKDSDILGNHVLVGNDEDRMSDIGSGHIVHNADAKIARQAAEDEIQESEKGVGVDKVTACEIVVQGAEVEETSSNIGDDRIPDDLVPKPTDGGVLSDPLQQVFTNEELEKEAGTKKSLEDEERHGIHQATADSQVNEIVNVEKFGDDAERVHIVQDFQGEGSSVNTGDSPILNPIQTDGEQRAYLAYENFSREEEHDSSGSEKSNENVREVKHEDAGADQVRDFGEEVIHEGAEVDKVAEKFGQNEAHEGCGINHVQEVLCVDRVQEEAVDEPNIVDNDQEDPSSNNQESAIILENFDVDAGLKRIFQEACNEDLDDVMDEVLSSFAQPLPEVDEESN